VTKALDATAGVRDYQLLEAYSATLVSVENG